MSALFSNCFSLFKEICFKKGNGNVEDIVDPDTYRDAILRVMECWQ